MPDSATTTTETASDADRWSWLQDTYWYVPEAYLPAISQTTGNGTATITTVADQTLWHIERVENNYILGSSVLYLDGQFSGTSSMVGSVTPEAGVYLSFTPLNQSETTAGSPPPFGVGHLTQYQGAWAFLMQMTNGTNAANLSHWAYMVRTTPDDPSWTDLPSVPGVSVSDAFA